MRTNMSVFSRTQAGAMFLTCALTALLGPARAATPAASGPVEPWVVELQRYAAQPNLQNDRPYASEGKGTPSFKLADLLRALPEPADWPQLRHSLAEATAKAPEGVERSRLQAGGWLLAYLLGDRAAVLAGLPAPLKEGEQPQTPAAVTLENLRRSLADRESGEIPPEKQVQQFEAELTMLEPVNLDEVKRVLGGEDNLKRLNRLLDRGKEMQAKMEEIEKEYEKTKDETAARAKAVALNKEFESENAADEAMLGPLLESPVIGRYARSVVEGEESSDETESATVPDLVKFAGRERAEALLHRALKLQLQLSLDDRSSAATAKLARELALAEVAALKVPSWGLVQAVDAGELFAAMSKRFPVDGTKENYEYTRACGYYLAGLIQQGRGPEAVAFATRPEAGAKITLPYDVLNALEHSGQAEQLWAFLRVWLGRYPAADEWDRFNRLSVQLGRQDDLKAMIKAMAASGAFSNMDRLHVQRMQADAELAVGDFLAAVARLQALLQPVAVTPDERKFQLELAVKLLRLAALREDAPGLAAAQAAAEAVMEKSWIEKPADALEGAADLVMVLNTCGHFTDSARIGAAVLTRVAALKQQAAEQKPDVRERIYVSDYELRKLLSEQLRAVVELGRWPEALALIQENPWWGARDASGLLKQQVSSDRKPVGYYLARVAQQQGQTAIVRRLLEAQLVAAPGADSIYASYLELMGQDARPLLAKLAAVDRYQERPLIWKARLQCDAREWDAAIVTLQEAITIDPSDGEEWHGDRMRVYAFMARALAAKGDKEKAAFFDGVVKAIRLSETGDDWFEAGAYARAIEIYRQALGFFQDAYCIQSRLAIRLADQGKMDEAIEHYRRAFELMPDSFGRVESHCFGCEHVFAGEKSQSVAEAVFRQMLGARPDKPQLHYLMGYLREEEERKPEAAEFFREAVQLDPLYLNAWNRLAGLEQDLKFTPGQRDDLYLKLLELDPARRHVSPDLEKVTDLPRLWTALRQARGIVADLPGTQGLWELKASAAQSKDSRQMGSDQSEQDAADVLVKHNFVQALQTYLAALNLPAEEH